MPQDKNGKITAAPYITEAQLKAIYPNCSSEKIKSYAAAFNVVFPIFEVNTPARIAAFLGQVAVESGELKYDKELGSKYNKKNPKDPITKTSKLTFHHQENRESRNDFTDNKLF